jgi:hypothetical protein
MITHDDWGINAGAGKGLAGARFIDCYSYRPSAQYIPQMI